MKKFKFPRLKVKMIFLITIVAIIMIILGLILIFIPEPATTAGGMVITIAGFGALMGAGG